MMLRNPLVLLAFQAVLLLLSSLLEFSEAGFRDGFKRDAEPLSKEEIRRRAHRLMAEDDTHDEPTHGAKSSPARERTVSGDTLDFVIVMQEMAYAPPSPTGSPVPLGTKFAFSGEITTDEDELGRATGSCVVASEKQDDLTVCDYFLKFYFEDGDGSLALTGHTDAIDGHFQVTGSGGSLSGTNSGYGRVYFDPAGNPILYFMITLS